MRYTLTLLILLAVGCASAPALDPAPPPGVDLSGHWHLNAADSDDPLHIPQTLGGGATPGSAQRSGRSARNGNPGGGLVQLPVPVPMSLVTELLRWPGTDIDLHQQGGVATFNSDGDSRTYQPNAAAAVRRSARRGRRAATAAVCGWSGAALVVNIGSDDDQPAYEVRYRLSDDGARLLQTITLQDGRLAGFTLSRVWDRQ